MMRRLLLPVLLAAAGTACGSHVVTGTHGSLPAHKAISPTTTAAAPAASRPSVPASGSPVVSTRGPTDAKRLAITFDDGFCTECIGAVVTTLERTGAHVTFCPNGQYAQAWAPHAERIRTLIDKGQIVMCNHTVNHKKSTTLSDQQLAEQLNRNDQWIEKTFGVSSKPWFRPPYGDRNKRTDAAAAANGYSQIVMWSGSVNDWEKPTPERFLQLYRAAERPGGIVLAHLNTMQTATLFEQMIADAHARGYTLCTVLELLGHPPAPAAPVDATTTGDATTSPASTAPPAPPDASYGAA